MKLPEMNRKKVFSWSATSVVMTLAILAVAYGVWQLWSLILIILTSIVVASFVESIARLFEKTRVPRVLIVILVYVIVFGVIAGVMYLFIPTFMIEFTRLLEFLPELGDSKLAPIIDAFKESGNLSELNPLDLVTDLQGTAGNISGGFFRLLGDIFGGILNLILVIVISFYLAIEKEGMVRFIRSVSPVKYEKYAVDLWRRTEYKIGQWFKGQLTLAIILALLTYLGLWFFGAPYALMLSVLAGVMGLVPFGIIFAGIVAIVIAYTSDGGGLIMALKVLVWYTLLQQLENHIFQPLIIKKFTGVPSLVVLLSVIIGASLWGFLGLILGMPLAVFVMELIKDKEDNKRDELQGRKKKKELAAEAA